MKIQNKSEVVTGTAIRGLFRAHGLLRRGLSFLFIYAMLLTFVSTSFAGGRGVGGKRDVEVMQVNLYIGGNAERLLEVDPSDPNFLENLVAAVTGLYYEVVASHPDVRLAGVAKAIVARMPDIVSIEEGTLLRNQSPGDLIFGGDRPATNVVYDYIQILLNKLRARGAHYVVAATANDWDIELPMFNLQTGTVDDIRQTDREAILVRADLPPGQLRVSHPQSGHFQNVIVLAPLGLSITRGWCSVEVFCRGRNFHYICTHLEQETVPEIQALQAQELTNGPANTKQPVLIVGDFNSDPLDRDGSEALAYDAIIAGGFKDAWAALRPQNLAGGLTWGHDEYLADPTVLFNRRIDFVFFRGATFRPDRIQVQDMWLNRIQPPLWASDHAAVYTSFLLK